MIIKLNKSNASASYDQALTEVAKLQNELRVEADRCAHLEKKIEGMELDYSRLLLQLKVVEQINQLYLTSKPQTQIVAELNKILAKDLSLVNSWFISLERKKLKLLSLDPVVARQQHASKIQDSLVHFTFLESSFKSKNYLLTHHLENDHHALMLRTAFQADEVLVFPVWVEQKLKAFWVLGLRENEIPSKKELNYLEGLAQNFSLFF